MFDVDLTAADLEGGKILPGAVWYPVVIKTAKKTISTKSSEQLLKITYEVTENPQPDTVGTAVFDNFVIRPDLMWKMGPFLNAVNPGIGAGKHRLDENAFKGMALEVFIVTGEYEGRKQNQVKNYAPRGTNVK